MKKYIAFSLGSFLLLFLEKSYIFSLGKIIHTYFPCEQNLGNSLPCYSGYDFYFMAILLIIFIVSMIGLSVEIYKKA
ncbi:MAG: hypothetical protein IPN70_04190 [Candidatus Moraniibacteriota bacterium]|nr:MAG: hypothetical protein IPN70_04190 [Candidatus Moranbacteria bacterium]